MTQQLSPCPWCGSEEHLYVSKCGSLTGDMPDRPYRVVCDHIDHDQVQGPVAYGKQAAIAAWNTRISHSLPGDGMQFVPVKPTEAMYLAAFESSPWDGSGPIRRVVDEVWAAMLRAALSSPLSGDAAPSPEGRSNGAGEDAELVERIYLMLRDWRLYNTADEDGASGYPLVDACTPPGGTIDIGEEELRDLAADLASLTAPPTSEERLREALEWIESATSESFIQDKARAALSNEGAGT